MTAARPAFVILGASNVSRHFPWIISRARALTGRSPDIFVAAGFGRSYGRWSRILFRGIPGILQCGLWDSLDKLAPAPLWTLITDVGNDIFYEIPPDEIAEWVEECVERLTRREARVAMTLMPLESGRRIGSFQYQIMRRILFPRCALSLRDALDRGEALQERLRRIGRQRNIPLIELPGEWFGLDPIHYRRDRLPALWNRAAECWGIDPNGMSPARQGVPASRLRFLRPEKRAVFHRGRTTPQPACVMPDGSAVSLF